MCKPLGRREMLLRWRCCFCLLPLEPEEGVHLSGVVFAHEACAAGQWRRGS